MIKLASRRAAFVLSGSAVALVAGTLPAQAATTGWRVDATFSVHASASVLTSVDAVSGGDAWAVGFTAKDTGSAAPQSVIRHWAGKTWKAVTLPAKTAKAWAKEEPVFSVVGASSPKDVWIFGGFSGGYLRLNGKRWSTGHLPGSSAASGALVEITAVKVFSSGNVWAFGTRAKFSANKDTPLPYAAHYNGSKWSTAKVPVPTSDGGVIAGVSAVSSHQMWAIENTEIETSGSAPVAGPPVVLAWTAATGWQDAAEQPTLAAGDELSSVTAGPGGDIWFGGSARNSAKGTTPLAAEWNGTTWSIAALPAGASSADWELGQMAPDGSGGIWAVVNADNRGSERLWHLSGTTWSQVTPNFGQHTWLLEALAWVPHTRSVWGAGASKRGSGADGLIAIDGPTPR